METTKISLEIPTEVLRAARLPPKELEGEFRLSQQGGFWIEERLYYRALHAVGEWGEQR